MSSYSQNITLPKLHFAINSEPNQIQGPDINQFAQIKNINIVKEIIGDELFQRIKQTFLGPILRFCSRKQHMSGKLLHVILTRSLITKKKKELWFHFGSQPMRFSIREFHMITGLKCSEWNPEEEEEEEQCDYNWGNFEKGHTTKQLIDVLRKTDVDSVEERFSLAMLILIESLLLQQYKLYKFPQKLIDRAKNRSVLMNYPWGRDAFYILLEQINKRVPLYLKKSWYDIHGFPYAFHMWILESVPSLQIAFSTVRSEGLMSPFLCEKYVYTSNPKIVQVTSVENVHDLKVHCILPSIPEDPEDNISLEDSDDEDLYTMVNAVKKGYRMTSKDWKRGTLDFVDAMDQVNMTSYRFPNTETAGPSSDSGECLISKLNDLCKTVGEGFNKINSRLTKIEEMLGIKENPPSRQEKSNDEGNLNPKVNVSSQSDGLDQINICSQPGHNANEQDQDKDGDIYPSTNSPTILHTEMEELTHTHGDSPVELNPYDQTQDINQTNDSIVEETPTDEIRADGVTQTVELTQTQEDLHVEAGSEPVFSPIQSSLLSPSKDRTSLEDCFFSCPDGKTQTPSWQPEQTNMADGIIFNAIKEVNDDQQQIEEEHVVPIQNPSEPVNTILGTGLQNEAGQYNCFLNVIIQSLWNLEMFQAEFLRSSTIDHLHVGDPCVVCSLHGIFTALDAGSSKTQKKPVDPSSLKIALISLRPTFLDAMNDASEVMDFIFKCFHDSFAPSSSVSEPTSLESNCMGSWDCATRTCIIHSLFGMDILQQMICDRCELKSRRFKFTSLFHYINTIALQTMKVKHAKKSFEELLDLVDTDDPLSCDTEAGGCGKRNHVHKFLSTPPHVFTIVLGWQDSKEAAEVISANLALLKTEIDISIMYRGLESKTTYSLASMVCYYGEHYQCFTYRHGHGLRDQWILYDDKNVKVINGWGEVLSKCEKGHWQPQVLIYQKCDKAHEVEASKKKVGVSKRKQAESKKEDDAVENAKKRLKKETSNQPENVFLRRTAREVKVSNASKTPYRAPKNPALKITPVVNPVLDPFLTPDMKKMTRLFDWKNKKGQRIMIDGKSVSASWFTRLENPENSMTDEHISATLSMLAKRNNNYAAYFHNNHLPRATFINQEFFEILSSSYESFKKAKKYQKNHGFTDDIVLVPSGKMHPRKIWGTDVDVIYGMTFKSNHWIGMAINLKKRKITIAMCGHPTEETDIVLDHVTQFAEMLPVLMCAAANKAVMDEDRVPYELEELKGKDIPRTLWMRNCALFVLKMLECHSMGIKDMSNIADANAHDIRSKLACDLFEEIAGG